MASAIASEVMQIVKPWKDSAFLSLETRAPLTAPRCNPAPHSPVCTLPALTDGRCPYQAHQMGSALARMGLSAHCTDGLCPDP